MMSSSGGTDRESQINRCRPVLQDLNHNIIENVGNFFRRYFEAHDWSATAQRAAEHFKSSKPDQRVLGQTRDQFLKYISSYQGSLPKVANVYHTTTSQPMVGVDESDAPTIYLVCSETVEQGRGLEWADIQVFGHFSERPLEESSVDRMLFCMHAWRIFNNQPARVFLHGFYICGSLAQLWVFDRAGAFGCTPFDINSESIKFLTVIAGYTMMDRAELGHNPSIVGDAVIGKHIILETRSGTTSEQLFLEEQPVRKFPGIIYKGPTCYRAKRLDSEGWEFVVKFAWRDTLTEPEEAMTKLVTARKVWGVVQLYGHQDITSIADVRRELGFETAQMVSLEKTTSNESTHKTRDPPYKNLAFYCIAIHPIGRPMEDYTSLHELLCAFRDIAKGHRSLYIDGKILHQDVSKDNIMISMTKANGAPQGFLIDLDVARDLEADAKPKEGRKGTKPFMAIGVLLAKPHTYRHDLEGLFYCFLWIAICGRGKSWPPKGSTLWMWFQKGFEECAKRKSEDMQASGFRRVLGEFSPGFTSLIPVAEELWAIFFPKQDGSFLLGSDDVSEDPHEFYQRVIDAFDRVAKIVEE